MPIEVLPIHGKVLSFITGIENNYVRFITEDGTEYRMYHQQDCCESVWIEQVDGDITDLIGSPLAIAEKSTGTIHCDDESKSWTFYRFATNKGYVTIRWNGRSNGYYSTGVSFEKA